VFTVYEVVVYLCHLNNTKNTKVLIIPNFLRFYKYFNKKKNFGHFSWVVRVPILVKKFQAIYLAQYGQFTHQSIDLVKLGKNMWFLKDF
jgi:hypothetical protein